MFNVELLDKWVQDFNEEEAYTFLREAVAFLGCQFYNKVFDALRKPVTLTIPEGVTVVWDAGDAIELDFGDFTADYDQLGEYLADKGEINRTVVYYI